MSESETGLSGDLARLMLEQCDVDQLLAAHTPDGKGRCPTCKSIGCSTYPAAQKAAKMRARRRARVDAVLRARGLLDG